MKLPIKTKRDWAIAFFVVFIVFYYITLLIEDHIRDFMMKLSPVKLNLMNYPGGWGNFFLTGFFMTVILVGAMLLMKVMIKRIIIAAFAGVLFSLIMLAGFIIHTNLIVGTSKTMRPTNIWITSDHNTRINTKPEEGITQEFIEKAVALKVKPASEQNKLKADHKDYTNSCHIWISYPKKYGQSYDLIFYVDSDLIYSFHGNGTPESRVFYEDNGLIALLKQLEEQKTGS